MSETGKFFRKLREERGLSQDGLDTMLGYKSKGQYVSNFERGKSFFPFRKIHECINIFASDPYARYELTNEFEKLIAQDYVKRFRDAKD